uniref:Uncharacterized protein n=1 Tax=Nelumbo nucifera TaxID=4432 RepID=A0A822XL54_NELNU|nr:TPA_asm: hypothetical protein HUJ06_021018 [Nelumbo nucifera]
MLELALQRIFQWKNILLSFPFLIYNRRLRLELFFPPLVEILFFNKHENLYPI